MMIPRRTALCLAACLVLIPLLVVISGRPIEAASSGAKDRKRKTVWLVFFSSTACPRCPPVKDLIRGLKKTYPVRIKSFDVDSEKDYQLFTRLESIHSQGKFSVPLVMVGESILMGESEISKNLERLVRKHARSGGAPLPYLGNDRAGRSVHARSDPADCRCDGKGRPPSLGDEWRKIRAFLNRWL